MIRSGIILVASLGFFPARAADATTPIDYTQRNAPYAPAGTVAPTTQKPGVNPGVQDKRVTLPTVDKTPAAIGDRRAAIDVAESHEKKVQEKDSRRPQAAEHVTSGFDQRRATISTSDAAKPPTVAKYQEGMANATPWGPGAAKGNTAQFRPVDRATQSKINRFVFRKNPTEPAAPAAANASAALGGAPITPAAGGAVIQK